MGIPPAVRIHGRAGGLLDDDSWMRFFVQMIEGAFMKRSAIEAVVWALVIFVISDGNVWAQQMPVVWDGGDGAWESDNWNGGQTAADTMGNNRGGDGGHDIVIGGNSDVVYDPQVLSDFRPRIQNGPTTITIKEGSSLSMDSNFSDEFVDGYWTLAEIKNQAASSCLDRGEASPINRSTSISPMVDASKTRGRSGLAPTRSTPSVLKSK
jgi:hypothetical protein